MSVMNKLMNKLHTIAMGKLGIRPEKTFGF